MKVCLVSGPTCALNSLPQLGHVVSWLGFFMHGLALSPSIEAAVHGKEAKQKSRKAGPGVPGGDGLT